MIPFLFVVFVVLPLGGLIFYIWRRSISIDTQDQQHIDTLPPNLKAVVLTMQEICKNGHFPDDVKMYGSSYGTETGIHFPNNVTITRSGSLSIKLSHFKIIVNNEHAAPFKLNDVVSDYQASIIRNLYTNCLNIHIQAVKLSEQFQERDRFAMLSNKNEGK